MERNLELKGILRSCSSLSSATENNSENIYFLRGESLEKGNDQA